MKKFEQSKDGLKTFPLANKIKTWTDHPLIL